MDCDGMVEIEWTITIWFKGKDPFSIDGVWKVIIQIDLFLLWD